LRVRAGDSRGLGTALPPTPISGWLILPMPWRRWLGGGQAVVGLPRPRGLGLVQTADPGSRLWTRREAPGDLACLRLRPSPV